MLPSDLCASDHGTPLYTIQPVLTEINQQLGVGVGFGVGSMMTFVIPLGVKKAICYRLHRDGGHTHLHVLLGSLWLCTC